MGRLNPADFPANVQDIVNETKPVILDRLSQVINQNNNLCSIVKTDTSALPESVWGLTSKTKQELLEIIARKDDVEVQNQASIKSHVEEINVLSDKYNELKSLHTQMSKDYSNAQIAIIAMVIIWVISVICYFVL